MSYINIRIDTDNAAFEDMPTEVARILRDAADKLEAGHIDGFSLRDINGNTVGELLRVR